MATKDELFRRTRLLAAAEEQAAIAGERAQLAREATNQDLLSLPVVAAALEASFSSDGDACERWAAEADASGDVLLARAIRRLLGSLREAASHAAALRVEAEGYAESVEEDQVDADPAADPPEATIGPTFLRT
jgi:hypothetical protein